MMASLFSVLPSVVCFTVAGVLATRGDTHEYGWFLVVGFFALSWIR